MTASELFAAVRSNDVKSVVDHLERHPEQVDLRNPERQDNSPTWDEWFPLQVAAKAGHLEMVKALVQCGATVYSHPYETYPAVAVAAWEKHGAVVSYFLEEIPETASGTFGVGITCNLAGRFGWMKQVRMHLERDPLAVHQRGWIGDTPLHWPAHNGHTDIVSLLLEHGADPNAEESNWIGGTPLHWASERNPEIVCKLVLAGADVNARVTRPGSHHLGATPLIWCAKQPDDSAACAQALLELGADPDLTDATGKRAKDYAPAQILAVL